MSEIKFNAEKLGRDFTNGVVTALLLWCVKITFIYAIISLVFLAIKPIDDCDKSRWDRCGVKVVTDAKTGKQYLLTKQGNIIER